MLLLTLDLDVWLTRIRIFWRRYLAVARPRPVWCSPSVPLPQWHHADLAPPPPRRTPPPPHLLTPHLLPTLPQSKVSNDLVLLRHKKNSFFQATYSKTKVSKYMKLVESCQCHALLSIDFYKNFKIFDINKNFGQVWEKNKKPLGAKHYLSGSKKSSNF